MSRTIETYRARFQDKLKAEKYAKRFEENSRKGIDRREQQAVRNIFGPLKNCHTVLDVPSGAGRFLSSLGHDGRKVIEMDVAREILQHAAKRAAQSRLHAGFVQGDGSRLPLADNAVDAVFCNRLLHHIVVKGERAMILRELRRVARRYVVVSFFDYGSFGAVRKILKKIKGSKTHYDEQPTLKQFHREATACGLRVLEVVPTGPPWVSQKFFVMEKV